MADQSIRRWNPGVFGMLWMVSNSDLFKVVSWECDSVALGLDDIP